MMYCNRKKTYRYSYNKMTYRDVRSGNKIKSSNMNNNIIMILILLINNNNCLNITYLSNKDLLQESLTSKFFTNFLQKFRGFHIIFHYHTVDVFYVSNVVRIINISDDKNFAYSSLLLYNHDLVIAGDFRRPKVSKTVNILFDFNKDLWLLLAKPENIKSSDVLVFIGSDELQKDLIDYGENFLKLAGNVLLLQTITNRIEIYKTCYYCGEKSKIFQLLESSNYTEVKTNAKVFLPYNFKDLNGHLLHTTFINYFPYMLCNSNTTRPYENEGKKSVLCTHPLGIESHLLSLMSKKLNFKYLIHFMDSEASFFNMIQFINRGEADIAFGGISMTADRIPLVQFTKQYNFEDYNFLYLFDLTIREIFNNFVAPFTAGLVWSLYFTGFFILSIVLYLAFKLKIEIYPGFDYHYSLWTLLQIVLEQSNPYIPKIYSCRFSTGFILACWWLGSLIISTMYKSTVLSAMVYPPNMEPPDLESLVKAGYWFAGNEQMKDMIQDLLNVGDPLYKEALKKTTYGENTCDVFNKILAGHMAMLDEQSTIQYEIRQTCSKPDDNQIELLRICRKAVRVTGHAWATQPGAPYTPAINYYLSLVLSAGLFKKWKTDTTSPFIKNQIRWAREQQSGETKPLSFKRFLPLLIIYFVGITIASVSFGVELLYWKFNRIK